MRLDCFETYKKRIMLVENNPVGKDANKDLIYNYESPLEIPNSFFTTPKFSVLLPPLPDKVLKETEFKKKQILLKLSTIRGMLNRHTEILKAADHKKILDLAIYHPIVIMQGKPNKKPNYYAAVNTGEYYAVSVLDTNPKNKYIEIVDWRLVNQKGYNKMCNTANLEDGQILIIPVG